MKTKLYFFNLLTDQGRRSIQTRATSQAMARQMISQAENCPLRAIVARRRKGAQLNNHGNKQLLENCLWSVEHRENGFPVINYTGSKTFYNGTQATQDQINAKLKSYAGLVLEINDHGNVSLSRRFKNGNQRELANQV